MGHQGGTFSNSVLVHPRLSRHGFWMDGALVIKYLKLLQSLFKENNRVSCLLSSTLGNICSTIEFSSSRKE
jgi:hypothetical protein